MAATALTSTSTTVTVGDRWVFAVDLVDDDCVPVTTAPAVLVTLPDGSTTAPTAEQITAGRWRAFYTPTSPGRHIATVTDTVTADVVAFAAYAIGLTTAGGMPIADDVAAYLGDAAASWTTTELADALAVESAAQRDVCRVPAAYPDSLRGALLRRVARHLAMRRLPLAMAGVESDAGPTALPGSDPEVRRLERPYRRWVIA